MQVVEDNIMQMKRTDFYAVSWSRKPNVYRRFNSTVYLIK